MSIGKMLAVLVVVGSVTLFYWVRTSFPMIHYDALTQAEHTARAGYTWPARGLRWVATDVFPSHGGCGNVIRNERLRLVLIDTELLRHSHGPEAATRHLLPHVLLADDTILVDRMITLLSEQHSASELRDLMQEAIASPRHAGPSPYDYSIRLLDVEVPFDHFGSDQSPQETLAQMNFVSRVLGTRGSKI